MTWRRVILAGLWALLATTAQAHRLDEYLQASTVEVARGEVTLQLRLTPGVAVAPHVLADMGAGTGHPVDTALQQAYAARARGDLDLSVDGVESPLQWVSVQFPDEAALRGGVGETRLVLRAPVTLSPGVHRLAFTNRHAPGNAVYLANALVPRDPGIHILEQKRNLNQSSYRLVFRVDAAEAPADAAIPAAAADRPAPPASESTLMAQFFAHGVHHILTGYDHLLFAGALVLAARSLLDLFKLVTAFTLAHSLTLGLSALGYVHLPAMVVEPVIAASIVVVAVQNVVWPETRTGHGRLAVAFVFGLFHGLGFAGGLLNLLHEMPRHSVLAAILGFSVGVEVAHQIVLLPVFAAMRLLRTSIRDHSIAPAAVATLQRLLSAGIGAGGLYYLTVATIVAGG